VISLRKGLTFGTFVFLPYEETNLMKKVGIETKLVRLGIAYTRTD